jgi:hypothetical protein
MKASPILIGVGLAAGLTALALTIKIQHENEFSAASMALYHAPETCTEYSHHIDKATFSDGAMTKTPIEPTPEQSQTLYKMCVDMAAARVRTAKEAWGAK